MARGKDRENWVLGVNISPELTSGPGLPHCCCAWQAAPAPQLGCPSPKPARHVSNRAKHVSNRRTVPEPPALAAPSVQAQGQALGRLRWAQYLLFPEPGTASAVVPPRRDRQRGHRSCQVTGDQGCLFHFTKSVLGRQGKCPSTGSLLTAPEAASSQPGSLQRSGMKGACEKRHHGLSPHSSAREGDVYPGTGERKTPCGQLCLAAPGTAAAHSGQHSTT